MKNAYLVKKEGLRTPYSRIDHEIAKKLIKYGFLTEVTKRKSGGREYLDIRLSYENGDPLFQDFRIISKPSNHRYIGYRDLKPVMQHFGVGIISTPKGILSDTEARNEQVGGEYLFQIW